MGIRSQRMSAKYDKTDRTVSSDAFWRRSSDIVLNGYPGKGGNIFQHPERTSVPERRILHILWQARRGKIKKDGTQGRKNRRSKSAGDRRGYIHAAGRACLRHKRKGRYEWYRYPGRRTLYGREYAAGRARTAATSGTKKTGALSETTGRSGKNGRGKDPCIFLPRIGCGGTDSWFYRLSEP